MRVFGKLNVFLNVLEIGEKSSSYHEIQSVFAPCFDIYDEISLSVCNRGEGGVFFSVSENILNCGNSDFICEYKKMVESLSLIEDNAKRALNLFCEKFGGGQYRVEIAKGIPFLAGMGGSSADAVGVLKCLCEKTGKSYQDVAKICDAIGSDLAGMWSGGVNFCSGRGENAVEIASDLGGYAVVCVPNFGISTREIFQKFDSTNGDKTHFEFKEKNEFDFISNFSQLSNSLQIPAFSAFPKMAEFAELICEKSRVDFLMTGSGSGMFHLCRGLKKASEIHDKIKDFCAFSAVTRV